MSTLSDSMLRQIVARSSFFTERLTSVFSPVDVDTQAFQLLYQERLSRWKANSANNDEVKFARRLTWSKLDEPTLQRGLAAAHFADDQPLPEWANTLRRIADRFVQLRSTYAQNYAYFFPEQVLPFERLMIPFVEAAKSILATSPVGADFYKQRLQPAAQTGLERTLLINLVRLFENILSTAFAQFEKDKAPAEKRAAFTEHMLNEGLINLLSDYPVAARFAAVIVESWVAFVNEFLEQLVTDWSRIRDAFCIDADQPDVVKLEAGLSERHHHGKTVIIVTFSENQKLVYKPKGMAVEAAFQAFLRWLNTHHTPFDFKVLTILDCTTHGWIEYVTAHAPKTDLDRSQGGQRMGALLCLLYALGATDCHTENVFMVGEYPVLVDIETVMSPLMYDIQTVSSVHTATASAIRGMQNSILRSLGLANWIRLPTGHYVNIGGLQDTTEVVYDNVLVGFTQMYRFLLVQREAILSPNGPLALMRNTQVRVVFRPTHVYAQLLKRGFEPNALRDGVDWELSLEMLSRAFMQFDDAMGLWHLLYCELSAMYRLDVPYISANTHQTIAFSDGMILHDFFAQSAFDVANGLFRQLSDADLDTQRRIIRYSYCEMQLNAGLDRPHADNIVVDATSYSRENRSDSNLWIQKAEEIGEALKATAIEGHDTSINWLTLEQSSPSGRFVLKMLRDDLYSGRGGVALFLAALWSATGKASYRELAFGAVHELQARIKTINWDEIPSTLFDSLLGAGVGFGSHIYTLAQLGILLNDSTLIDQALRSAVDVPHSVIKKDTTLDVSGGSAGYVLVLCALHELFPTSALLESAVVCGDHLLQSSALGSDGTRRWVTLEGKPMAGFAHGAAGITYALLRLHRLTGEQRFYDAALQGLGFERTLFVESVGNWRDLRNHAKGEFMVSWCHGAVGIGIGRLASRQYLDDSHENVFCSDIEVALRTTVSTPLYDRDNICCGNWGRTELFLLAEQQAKHPAETLKWRGQRYALISSLLHRAEVQGFSVYPLQVEGVIRPSLFQGISGIGYMLLRNAQPDRFPSLLTWQSAITHPMIES